MVAMLAPRLAIRMLSNTGVPVNAAGVGLIKPCSTVRLQYSKAFGMAALTAVFYLGYIQMTNLVTCDRKEETLTFKILGEFDYTTGVKLKKLAQRQSKADEYIIDLKMVKYINSSAFGAMIVLKEIFQADDNSISLINASPEIMQMLKAVHFDKLFRVT
jgi:anti-anti-sigma factor